MSSHDGLRPPDLGDSQELMRLAGMLWPDVELDAGLAPLVCLGIAGRPDSLVAVRHSLQRWAAHTGLPALDVADLVLASYEALANAVEHAYPPGGGPVDLVSARSADRRVLVAVRDYGRWRPQPRDPGSRGRGLPMINTLAHRAKVQQSPHGTYVLMEWQLSTAIGATGRKRDEVR